MGHLSKLLFPSLLAAAILLQRFVSLGSVLLNPVRGDPIPALAVVFSHVLAINLEWMVETTWNTLLFLSFSIAMRLFLTAKIRVLISINLWLELPYTNVNVDLLMSDIPNHLPSYQQTGVIIFSPFLVDVVGFDTNKFDTFTTLPQAGRNNMKPQIICWRYAILAMRISCPNLICAKLPNHGYKEHIYIYTHTWIEIFT